MKPFLFAVVGSQLGCYQSLLQLQTSSSQAVSAGAISTAAIALPSPISTREVITIDDDSDGSVYEDPIDHSDDRMSYISGVSMICLDTEPPKDASPDASVLSDSSVLFDEEDASEAFTDTPDTSQQSQLNGNSAGFSHRTLENPEEESFPSVSGSSWDPATFCLLRGAATAWLETKK